MSVFPWYHGRRVAVTGHTGFKGAWLSAWLVELGADVVGYALPPEAGSLFEAAGIAGDIRSVTGDVRDADHFEATLRDAAPDVVFHLAAQSLVRPSYLEPVETFAANVMGTVHLLDAARRIPGMRAVVVVTSDKCYEPSDRGEPHREDAPLGGHDPYSASKACAEIVTAAFARSFFGDGTTAVASARAGNVIGGGDWAVDRLIPDLMRAAIRGEPALIRRPDAVRPWQFVLEPLYGYLLLGRMLADYGRDFGGSWNFGPSPDDAAAVRQVAAACAAHWPRAVADFADVPAGPHETASLRLNSAKSAARLSWQPTLSLDDSIAWTIHWYRQVHEQHQAPRAILREQLAAYQRRQGASDGEG